MKKLHYEIKVTDNNPKLISSYEDIMAAAMTQIERLVCKCEYLLPRGWRCIIKIDDPNGNKVHLDLQSNKGGGSFAEVKMKTLEDFVFKVATGVESITDIRELIRDNHLEDTPIGKEIIFGLDSVDGLERKHHDWLKEILGYTCFYGALKVPYNVLSAKVGSSKEVRHGEVRIAFSGASQEQDVMFAMGIFHELQKTMVRTFTKEQFWFRLRDLENIPNIKLWIDLFGINVTA